MSLGRTSLSSISPVMNVIRHQPGTPIAIGELTLDLKFAGDFLSWRENDVVPDALSDNDLLIACCQSLMLDLVCIIGIQRSGPHLRFCLALEGIIWTSRLIPGRDT